MGENGDIAAIWERRNSGQSNRNIPLLLSASHDIITGDLGSLYTPYKPTAEAAESFVCNEPYEEWQQSEKLE